MFKVVNKKIKHVKNAFLKIKMYDVQTFETTTAVSCSSHAAVWQLAVFNFPLNTFLKHEVELPQSVCPDNNFWTKRLYDYLILLVQPSKSYDAWT